MWICQPELSIVEWLLPRLCLTVHSCWYQQCCLFRFSYPYPVGHFLSLVASCWLHDVMVNQPECDLGRIRFNESGSRFIVCLDLWVLSEVTSLLFVYVCDTDVTSGFASKSTSKLHSLDSRIRIRTLNGRIHWIWKIWIRIQICQIKYGLSPTRWAWPGNLAG